MQTAKTCGKFTRKFDIVILISVDNLKSSFRDDDQPTNENRMPHENFRFTYSVPQSSSNSLIFMEYFSSFFMCH